MRVFKPVAVAAVAMGLVALSGCTPSDADAGPVQLAYWAWTQDSQKVVDQWNSEHPDIQVSYTDAGGGTDSSAKLVTAARAGNGPDVALVQNDFLPAMVVAGVPLDITDLVADVKDVFAEGAWAQTTFDGVVYGVPQDVGPMANVYRADRLKELGVAVPTTWKEWGEAAAAVRAADPNTFLASLPPAEFGFWAGVASQAGSQWWSVDGDVWTVGIADEPSLEVADFFGQLVKDGVVSTEPLLTPEYNAMLNNGTMLSWPSAVWAPSVIENVAIDTAGGWEMGPMPQWTPGKVSVAYVGGSSLVVTATSAHPKEAAEFAKWLDASEEGNDILINTQALYPASIVGQNLTADNPPPPLMPQQTDFYAIAAKISLDTIPVTWGPNVGLARTVFQDEVQKAIDNGTPWRDAFIATQKAVVADMIATGFKVSNG